MIKNDKMNNSIPSLNSEHQDAPGSAKLPVSRRFVLLKNILGNVFWTTDDGDNYEAEGFEVLHRGDNDDEMVKEWQKHYNLRLYGG